MATGSLLNDAVVALRDKVIAASANATPEELAYIGTALEKIGGRISVMDVMDAANGAKTDAVNAVTAAKDQALVDIGNLRDAILNLLAQKRQEEVALATSAIDQARTTAEADVKTNVDAAVANVNALIAQLTADSGTAKATIDKAITDAQAVAKTLAAQQNVSRTRIWFYGG